MTSPPADEDLDMPVPAPWAAAVAVMALLAFGVLVGSSVSPVAPSGAATPILVALTPTATKAAKPLPVSQAPTSPPTTQAPTPSPATTTEPVSTSTTTASTPSKPKGESKGLSTPSATAQLPPIKHVFLIVLSDQGAAAFSPGSSAPYLAKTLPHAGELLENYFAVSSGELANAIALTSGQGPTPQTAADCPLYTDVTPAAAGAEGQVLGSGCVYPRPTLTLGDQLTRAGKSWKAYVEGIEMGGPGQPTSCRHPALGATGVENAPSPQDAYVTWRNPFVYFHSLIDSPQCAKDDIGLGRLASDLKKTSTTPSLAYIVPDRCHDGSEAPCAPGQPAGLPATEVFLRKVVPEIKASAAYNQGALIAITFDQAPQSGPAADSSGCCMTAPYPNLPPPATPSTTEPTSPSTSGTGSTGVSGAQTATPTGGGRVGLLLISKYVKPASLNVTGEYNHFALLRSIENLFGLKPLGYAGAPGLLAFDSSVFNAYK
jgi:phosphatidylinositol-3-phosphatase